MTQASAPIDAPTVIVVGAAARDITDDDPRGWRLGGGVSYGALTAARLGLRTGAIIGVDAEAADAVELDLLRSAGVEIHLVPLERGPVFVNIERPEGRLQLCRERSDEINTSVVPEAWRLARGWILAPVAVELPESWSDLPSPGAIVGVGWQGLLRELVPGSPVRHLRPGPNRIIGRADIVGLSRDDVEEATDLADVCRLLHAGAMLAVTQGDRGGMVLNAGPDGPGRARYYPPVRSHHPIDPTGAGDVFLAALAAARIEPRLVGNRIDAGFDLLLAAAAASLVLEGPGLQGVPDRAAVRDRIVAARAERASSAR
jgi:sugar/nucleoside kinase (ribokinase family)